MKEKVLTLRQQIWAYARWCDGYTYQQIADVLLYCHLLTHRKGAIRNEEQWKRRCSFGRCD